MREFVVSDEVLATMFTTVMPHLDERQRRIVAGAAARSLGRGGIAAVAEATSMSRSTVQKAVAEIDAGVEVSARVRHPGAGRPRVEDAQPGLLLALDDLVEPESRGEPRPTGCGAGVEGLAVGKRQAPAGDFLSAW